MMYVLVVMTVVWGEAKTDHKPMPDPETCKLSLRMTENMIKSMYPLVTGTAHCARLDKQGRVAEVL